jgi:hypothetical protein
LASCPNPIPPTISSNEPEELKVNLKVAHLLALVNLLALAQRAAVALQRCDTVDPSRGVPPLLGDSFDVGMSTKENFVALVFEVGAFRNLLKIF